MSRQGHSPQMSIFALQSNSPPRAILTRNVTIHEEILSFLSRGATARGRYNIILLFRSSERARVPNIKIRVSDLIEWYTYYTIPTLPSASRVDGNIYYRCDD
jgi:hypothetical protein